jgi:peptidoglycan/LPS O-acetylase OafA/YrhL
MDRPQRLQVLDSVRGLAAAAVVLHHMLLAFWPYLADPNVTPPPGRAALSRWVAASPLAVAHSGAFAVVVFFVLSGFVLAHSALADPQAVPAAALRRYFRLAGPVLASVLLSYGLLRAGLYRNGAATAAGASAWLGGWYQFTPQLLTGPMAAVPRALVGTFANGGGTPFNNVLWTMSVELPGSLLVFATVALVGRMRNRWVLYAIAGWVLAGRDSLLFDFLLGLALCDLYRSGKTIDLPPWAAAPLLAAAAVLATHRTAALGDDQLPGLSASQTVAASLVVMVPLLSPSLRRWADARPLAWLGRISFGLYLAHMLVIASVGSAAYVALRRSAGWPHDAAALAAAGATLVASLAGGWGVYRLADRPSVRLGRRIVDLLFLRRPSAPLPIRPAREPQRVAA